MDYGDASWGMERDKTQQDQKEVKSRFELEKRGLRRR